MRYKKLCSLLLATTIMLSSATVLSANELSLADSLTVDSAVSASDSIVNGNFISLANDYSKVNIIGDTDTVYQTNNNRRNSNYGYVVKSYLYSQSSNQLVRVEALNDSRVVIENYATGDVKYIDYELPIFGGFYHGSNYNFLVFGQNNTSESNTTEVVRVVKYDQNWNRLGACSYKGCNTYIPFDAGSCRMAEAGGKLYVATCHEMYMSSDGLHHQASMNFVINISNMTSVANQCSVSSNTNTVYASHSFNQFIRSDGTNVFRINHGDAYPRAINLTRTGLVTSTSINPGYVTKDIITFPGQIGANFTGADVGGMELSSSNVIVVGDYNRGEGSSVRDVFVAVNSKSTLNSVKFTYLTNYVSAGTGVTAHRPYIVKVSDSSFVVMWEERNFSDSSAPIVVKVAKIDGSGNLVGSVASINAELSDCQPLYCSDGSISWYVTDRVKTTLYTLSTSDISTVSKQQLYRTPVTSTLTWTDTSGTDSNGHPYYQNVTALRPRVDFSTDVNYYIKIYASNHTTCLFTGTPMTYYTWNGYLNSNHNLPTTSYYISAGKYYIDVVATDGTVLISDYINVRCTITTTPTSGPTNTPTPRPTGSTSTDLDYSFSWWFQDGVEDGVTYYSNTRYIDLDFQVSEPVEGYYAVYYENMNNLLGRSSVMTARLFGSYYVIEGYVGYPGSPDLANVAKDSNGLLLPGKYIIAFYTADGEFIDSDYCNVYNTYTTVTPVVTRVATPTPTSRPSSGSTNTPTPTRRPSSGSTNTPVPTRRVTATPTVRATAAPTRRVTATPTVRATIVPTRVATSTASPTCRPTSAPTTAPSSQQGIGDFVIRLYSLTLDRQPDNYGYNDWVKQLSNKTIDGGRCAYGFFFSQEYLAKNTTDSDYVETLYKVFFNRASDTDGKNYWLGRLSSGASREDVFYGFVNSAEWADLCFSYGINSGGNGVARSAIEAFVVSLYSDCLGRQPDQAGLNDWVNRIASGEITGKQAAYGFFFSPEFEEKANAWSDSEYIETFYKVFFNRASDPAGKAYWQNQIDATAYDTSVMFVGFADSVEFAEKCESYGISAGAHITVPNVIRRIR